MVDVPLPTTTPRRLYLKAPNPASHYDPKTPEEMTDTHKEMKRLLDYFQDKQPTDTMFADHAYEVFVNVDRELYPIWTTKIQVTMEEVFPILDRLRYGRDTILLLSVISPSSYRVLYTRSQGTTDLPHVIFTLEHGITGPPLDRKVDLELRKEIFYKEATEVTRTLKTTRFVSFIATQIQADFHGRHISSATKELKKIFWKLEWETPQKDQLAMAYEVLTMMRNPTPRSRVGSTVDQIEYSDRKWYAVSGPTQELQEPLPKPRPKKPKVSAEKKREDTRKRVARWKAKKKANKNAYKVVSNLNSSVEFQQELRSRSGSISTIQRGNKGGNQSFNTPHASKSVKSLSLRSSAKKHR